MRRVRAVGYTIHEVAAVAGCCVETVRNDARLGLWDRRDLASLVRYLTRPEPLSDVARQALLTLCVELGIDKVQPADSSSPGPHEPIMLLHSIHRRKPKKPKQVSNDELPKKVTND